MVHYLGISATNIIFRMIYKGYDCIFVIFELFPFICPFKKVHPTRLIITRQLIYEPDFEMIFQTNFVLQVQFSNKTANIFHPSIIQFLEVIVGFFFENSIKSMCPHFLSCFVLKHRGESHSQSQERSCSLWAKGSIFYKFAMFVRVG